MIKVTSRILLLLVAGLCGVSVSAAESRNAATVPTTLGVVIESSLQHFPQILAAKSQIDSKRGLALAAEGAFDPRLEGSYGSRLGGFYSGQSADATISQEFQAFNASVFAGYRVSDGSFPVYESAALTSNQGEARVGFALSLLRDRDIDEQRAARTTSRLQILTEQNQLAAGQLMLMQQAYVAYAQWLLAARLQESFEELLATAVQRGQALERSVAAGNAAEILQVENQQAVLQRQGLVIDARRQFDMAAEQLALYLRDGAGQSLYPLYESSLEMPAEDPAHFSQSVSQLLETVMERRPEIAIARLAQQEAGVKVQLAENLGKPRMDVRMYTSRDYGSGPAFLTGTDNVADISFSYPLRIREARGRAAAARAEIDSIGYSIQLLYDQVETDIRRALVNLDATRQMESLATEELRMSQTLAEAEQRRFDAGISDFFLLNVRERQIGEAQLKRWQAHLNHQVALANFYGASMNFSGLGQQTGQ